MCNDFRRDTGALYDLDTGQHGVCFYRIVIMGTDVDATYLAFILFGVNRIAENNYFTYIQQRQHRGTTLEKNIYQQFSNLFSTLITRCWSSKVIS